MSPAAGLAIQTVKGHEPAIVKVSNQDLNRIVAPAKILKVYTSKSIDVKVEGTEAYLKVPSTVTGPVELYLLTEQQTYTLMLVPGPIPAETVVIQADGESVPPPQSASYIQEIKFLLRQVANGSAPPGFDVAYIEDGHEESPVKECSLIAVRKFAGKRFMIAEYRLMNSTEESQTYHEGLFVRQGTRAVAIEQHELEPGGITRVFRVEEVVP
jgi:hypothetical protein